MSTSAGSDVAKQKDVPVIDAETDDKKEDRSKKPSNKVPSARALNSSKIPQGNKNTKKPALPPVPPGTVRRHRFIKKNFAHPTWCQFNNKFMTGLNKSGFECRDCSLPVSRRFIAEAKRTVCGETYDGMMEGSTGQQAQAFTKNKVFTVYLPHGAKKSVLLNPVEPLRNVLEKICATRGINMAEFVPEDTNGETVSMDTVLGKISGFEITFTRKDGEPPAPLSPLTSSTPVSSPSTPNLDKSRKADKPEKGDKTRRKSQKSSKQLNATPMSSNGSIASINTPPTTPLSSSHGSPDYPPTASGASTPVTEKPVKQLRITEAYDIGRELGSGAFSVVKEAIHKETGRVVAVKVLDKYEDDDEQTQKFKQEISIISSLHHEHIVQFYELDSDDENFYVAMELVGGGELFDYIIANGTIEEKEAACIIAQVLKAVEYMHSIGTAHRDLKPENLLFKTADKKIIKIADFGESKSFKDGMLNTYCGTPDYMAPEIIKGEPYSSPVDIWAIGVITYVMLAGFPPFDGENDVEVFASILAVRYDFPNPEWENISDDAKDFIASILLEEGTQRLSATQCLNHPWITKNVPIEHRTNAPPPSITPSSAQLSGSTGAPADGVKDSVDSDEEEEEKSRKKSKGGDDEDVELGDSPKKQVVEAVKEALKLATDADSPFAGELRVMTSILEATSGKGKPLPDLEKAIFTLYWGRVKEINSLLKQSGKKKKKK